MLLVYPPGARTTEPPLGIARIAGALDAAGVPVRCLDLSAEGVRHLLGAAPETRDPGEALAWRRRLRDFDALRDIATYGSRDRAARAVRGLEACMLAASRPFGVEAGLADYRDGRRSPHRRADLLDAARSFASNPYYPLFSKRLAEELDATGADTVGLSLCYLSQALTAFAIAGFLKAERPGVRVLLGGSLVNSWIAQRVLDPAESFGGFVDAIADAAGSGLLPDDADALDATPRFADFSKANYIAPRTIIPFNLSAGCPWRRCAFCPETAEGHPYRPLDRDRSSSQLDELVRRHEPGLFHFTDNEVSPAALRMLADFGPRVPWYGFARFSSVLDDAAFCRRLAASGCVMLQLGLESGDQAVLDALGKGTDLPTIERILACLADAGIATYVYVLFGTPAEDRDAAFRTRDFVASNAPRIGFLNVAVFNLPASSEEAKRLDTASFYDGELSLYRDFAHPRGWNRQDVREFLAKDFEADPAIKAILARDVPVFTSNLAPFVPAR